MSHSYLGVVTFRAESFNVQKKSFNGTINLYVDDNRIRENRVKSDIYKKFNGNLKKYARELLGENLFENQSLIDKLNKLESSIVVESIDIIFIDAINVI